MLIPEGMTEVHFFGFTYTSHYFESIQTLVWTVIGKLVPFISFTLLFIKIKQVWTFVLFVPLGMYITQMIKLLNYDSLAADTIEFYFILPFILLYCFFLYKYKSYLNRKRVIEKYKEDLVKTGLESLTNKIDKEDEA